MIQQQCKVSFNLEDKLITFVVKIAYLFTILHVFISRVMWNPESYKILTCCIFFI